MWVHRLTKEWWERWKTRQVDKGDQFATNESTDEEAGDAKEVAAWKTLFLRNGPHGAKEHSCQKGCSKHRVGIITGQQ